MGILAKWRKLFIEDLGWDRFSTTRTFAGIELLGVAEKRGVGIYFVRPHRLIVSAYAANRDHGRVRRENGSASRGPGWEYTMSFVNWRQNVEAAAEALLELHRESLVIAGNSIMRPMFLDDGKVSLSRYYLPYDLPYFQTRLLETLRFTLEDEDNLDLASTKWVIDVLFGDERHRQAFRRTVQGFSSLFARPSRNSAFDHEYSAFSLYLLLILHPEETKRLLSASPPDSESADGYELFDRVQPMLTSIGEVISSVPPCAESIRPDLPGTMEALHLQSDRLRRPPFNLDSSRASVRMNLPSRMTNRAIRHMLSGLMDFRPESTGSGEDRRKRHCTIHLMDLLAHPPKMIVKKECHETQLLIMSLFGWPPPEASTDAVYSGFTVPNELIHLYLHFDAIARLVSLNSQLVS